MSSSPKLRALRCCFTQCASVYYCGTVCTLSQRAKKSRIYLEPDWDAGHSFGMQKLAYTHSAIHYPTRTNAHKCLPRCHLDGRAQAKAHLPLIGRYIAHKYGIEAIENLKAIRETQWRA
ncbi:hypothetical protein PAPHI01_2342 [Pancytospora philotis]|nr:hypothetical protein PAPHI01_2342 [Pancytospora philotis]